MTKKLSGRIALITGASRGIGRALARAFAAEGAHLILLARTVGGLEEADDEVKAAGGTSTLVPLDLKDFDALDRLGASIHERWGKLDILIGNAGILGQLSPVTHIEPSDWTKLLDINLTANWRLIRSMDPLLRASDAGRAIFLTSSVGSKPRAYWGGYAV
jgi:NAD(P)-dependent dehydrogenase (short-subunit alcohol dehydrogenase family)